jgi:ankyrin repeat protein
MLIEYGCDLRKCSSGFLPGYNALHWAVFCEEVTIATAIIQKEPGIVNLTTNDEAGETPLHIASKNDSGAVMVQMLTDAGADPLAESKFGYTPLGIHLTITREATDLEVFSILLKANATNGYVVKRPENWTVLHKVVMRACMLNLGGKDGDRLLRHLLTFDFVRNLIDARDSNGWTCLHASAVLPDYRVIRILVQYGANVLDEDSDGKRAFDIVMDRARMAPPEDRESA